MIDVAISLVGSIAKFDGVVDDDDDDDGDKDQAS